MDSSPPPGREPDPANTRERRTWYGHGQLTRTEKGASARFFHDAMRLFADVSIPSLPVLFYVMGSSDGSIFGLTTATLAAWLTMTVVATAIRGGWLAPLATDTLGWVSLSPALVALRIGYYNVTLLVAAVAGVELASSLGAPPVSLAVAIVVAVVATMAFPRLAETVSRRLESSS